MAGTTADRPDPSRVEAILWDNDGVLVDTERIYYRVTRRVLAGAGVDLTPELYRRHYLHESRGAWHLAAARGAVPEAIEAMRRERNRLYAERLAVEPVEIEGARDVLRSLRGIFRMAVVTSSLREPFETIHRRTGFLPFFEFALTREDYDRSKPSPDPYLVALRRTGLPPGRCLVVEDSPRGLSAARAAGIACWIVPSEMTRGERFSGADRILDGIDQVPAALGISASGRARARKRTPPPPTRR